MNKNILKLGLSLALFALGACASLALVYTVTQPTIAGHEAKVLQASLSDLFPDASSFEELDAVFASPDPSVVFVSAWAARLGDVTLGLAVKAVGKSYGGDAILLVGVKNDRRLAGIRILELSDTPGLGANATNPTYFVDKTQKTTFPDQFINKPVTDAFETKADIVAITASTITSKALATVAKAAGEAGLDWLESSITGGGK